MKQIIKSTLRPLIQRFSINKVQHQKKDAMFSYPPDFTESNIKICNAVRPYTMTSPERINALIEAVRYVVANNIDGSMVECGVWKGGSTMAMAMALKELGDESRDLHLYDTFSGMSVPRDIDRSLNGGDALKEYSKTRISEGVSSWCLSPLEEVKENVFSTGYNKEKFHFIKGKVEDSIPAHIPTEIALLRLDTDWYESTKHELNYLYPLLKTNGVLIIDDYGHWEGARKAVDEYIADKALCILLNRIDYTGRIGIKT